MITEVGDEELLLAGLMTRIRALSCTTPSKEVMLISSKSLYVVESKSLMYVSSGAIVDLLVWFRVCLFDFMS